MAIPNTNEIIQYIHCGKCVSEIPNGVSPAQWSRLEVGWTALGFQVWCRRHNCNVMHVDFDGVQHTANMSAPIESA